MRPSIRWHWGFGGGWKAVLGVKIARRTVIIELLVGCLRLDWAPKGGWPSVRERREDRERLRRFGPTGRKLWPSERLTACPFCGHAARSTQEEVAHMEAEHPDIIEGRLRRAGMVP